MLYGGLTAQRVDHIMVSTIKAAGAEINRQRDTFTVSEKPPYPGKTDPDVVTSADIDAQAIIVEAFRANLPLFGVVGEEGDLRKPCELDDIDIYVTVDPLDGSKAYVRREAFGVSSMMALVLNGQTVAAYIYDINTGDLYGFSLATEAVWRERRGGSMCYLTYLLDTRRDKPLDKGYVLLRDECEAHHPLLAAAARSTKRNGVFKAYESTSGSIGLSMARLWNDQVVAHCVAPGPTTPWDLAPVLGISRRLGMVWLRPNDRGDGFEEYEPDIPAGVVVRSHSSIVMHRSRVAAFHKAVQRLTR